MAKFTYFNELYILDWLNGNYPLEELSHSVFEFDSFNLLIPIENNHHIVRDYKIDTPCKFISETVFMKDGSELCKREFDIDVEMSSVLELGAEIIKVGV